MEAEAGDRCGFESTQVCIGATQDISQSCRRIPVSKIKSRLQKARVQFPAPISCGPESPVTLVPRESGALWPL